MTSYTSWVSMMGVQETIIKEPRLNVGRRWIVDLGVVGWDAALRDLKTIGGLRI